MYYHLYSATMNPCSMTKAAYGAAEESWLCKACHYPKPGVRAIDVCIEDERLNDSPLGFVNGCGLAIGKEDFLLSLGPELVSQDLFLGKIVGPDGGLIKNWVTFRGRRRVIVRGDKNVTVRRCVACERNVYFAMGRRYLYPEPPKDSTLFESDLFGLVVPKAIFDKMNLSNWRKLIIDRLPVLSKPRDNLEQLVSFYGDQNSRHVL